MLRKFMSWLSNDDTLMLLSICLFICVLSKIVITGMFGAPVTFEEKFIWLVLLVGSVLWVRIEAICISKIEYNDAIARVEKLYFDQCRFERAICEKFNVVYRPDEDGLETFYDKEEYYDREYKKACEKLGRDTKCQQK